MGERTQETSRDERVSERVALEWSGQLVSALRSHGFFSPPAGESPSGAGGNGSAAVVPGSNEVSESTLVSQPSDTGSVNDGSDGKLTLELKTEEFGPLAVVLERTQDGVNVVIAGDAAAKKALLLDRQGLVEALTAGSGRVNSVRVLRRDEVGTNLAEGSLSRREKATDKAPTESPLPRTTKSHSRRRLNLIG